MPIATEVPFPAEINVRKKPRGAAMAVCTAGFLALAILDRFLPPPGTIAFLMAGSALAAWWCGRTTAIALVTGSLAIHAAIGLPQSLTATLLLILTGAVAIGLSWGTADIQQRLQRESYLARHDALTGLANRQAIFERCEVEISRAERFRRPLTLIMLDLNSFKMINDRAGHPAGDEVLRRTAEVLADTVRLYDLVGRLGGDEFIVLLPEAGTDAAQIVVERLQAALRLTIETAFPPVTFSIGAVTWLSPPDNVAECLAAVDRMLYSAKQSGDGSAKFATISGPAGNPPNP